MIYNVYLRKEAKDTATSLAKTFMYWPFILFFLSFEHLYAQQETDIQIKDGFLQIATDARAAAQGDIGVATAPDDFSQTWNSSKYLFHEEKLGFALTQILTSNRSFGDLSQLNAIFYNKPDDRSGYALSLRGYSYQISSLFEQTIIESLELEISGSYSLKLSDTFGMSVGGRYLLFQGKLTQLDDFGNSDAAGLFGVDVAGYYYGNEIAYTNFNGRWRAGINLSNVRGRLNEENRNVEVYAPTNLKTGMGFDFIFDANRMLGLTTGYTLFLDSNTENRTANPFNYTIAGSVITMGAEFMYRKRLIARGGYSKGINRTTDSFAAIGGGITSRYVDIDVAILFGTSKAENLARENLRISLSLDLEEVF